MRRQPAPADLHCYPTQPDQIDLPEIELPPDPPYQAFRIQAIHPYRRAKWVTP